MVDFCRAPAAHHPHRLCPDIDKWGYVDERNPGESGPIVSTRLRREGTQPRMNVRFQRTEISTTARLYALAADGNATIRIVSPNNALLPQQRRSTISFRPVSVGRTSIDIRYHWPDGPVIGRLYVDVRQTQSVNIRAHVVTVNGTGHNNRVFGNNRPATMTEARHLRDRITWLFNKTNHVWEPHGIYLNLRETVDSAWTNATLGPAGRSTNRLAHAMAHSPNRSATRINVYFVNAAALPFRFSGGLGPPIAWARACGYRWPNTAAGKVGSGVVLDTNTHNIPDLYLAHEFGHVFSLVAIVATGTSAGRALQWHSTGDEAAPGNSHGHASRDDSISRRRLMYNTSLQASNNAWRNNVGYGNQQEGAYLVQRHIARDITFNESYRAYAFSRVNANLYAT